MHLPPGWIAVHGWSWDDGWSKEKPAARMLVHARSIASVYPSSRRERALTCINLHGHAYAHTVEESVTQVQELMAHALAQPVSCVPYDEWVG